MASRLLTVQQVVNWNPAWSDLDRRQVRAALAAMPDWAEPRLPPSGGYIGVWVYGYLRDHADQDPFMPNYNPHRNTSDRQRWYRGLVIYPGRLEWPGGRWSEHLDRQLFAGIDLIEREVWDMTDHYDWLPLSTYQGPDAARGAHKRAATPSLCETHHVELPATGECDYCA